MAGAQYDVEYVEPERVREDVIRVWRDNLPAEGREPPKFDWTYAAPRPARGVYTLSARRAGEPARVVGVAGLLPREFFADGRTLTAALLADIAVDREHRTALPAIRLVRAGRRAVHERYSFGYSHPNPSAAPLFARCGYREIGKVTRYARVLRHQGYVRRKLDWPAVPWIAGAALDAAQRARRAPATLGALARFRLDWLDEVDARFDHLWSEARRAYRLVAKRDAAFLRWRFFDHPEKNVRIAALTDRGQERELRAYAAVTREDDLAHVRDLFGYPDDLGALLELLALDLARCGAGGVSINYFGSRAVTRTLAARGFAPRDAERPVIVDTGEEAPGRAALLSEPGHWHLTDADREW